MRKQLPDEVLSRERCTLRLQALHASDHNSAISITFEWLALGRILCFRVAEYTQTTQSQIDAYKYASGNKVIKVFIP